MTLIEWERREDGVLLKSAELTVRAVWQARGILRVAARPAGDTEPVLADGPMLDPDRARDRIDTTVRESDGELIASDGTLELHIDLNTGAFTYRDANGGLLFREPHHDGKLLQARADDAGYRARLGFVFSEGEALYGLGQHEEGRLDYRGRSQYLYQHNLKAVVPFLVSSRGWGLLWHGYSAMTFRDDAFGSYLDVACVEEMDYFVIAGTDLDEVVRGYRRLTGPAPIPPRWAFGYIQSRERYKDQKELLDAAERYADLGLPLACIVLDWQYWPGGQWGQKTLEPARFPDPEAMCDRLHELGTRLMVSIWPHMHGESADRLEFQAADKLLGNGYTYDAFDPEARALFWRQAEAALFAKGVDAWWCDCSEPFEADWSWEITLEPTPEERMRINVEEAERYLGPQRSNAYSLMHTSGIWENQRASGSTKRVLNLTRSAYAGQQRYGTITWSGDVSASWETLRRQIADGLNFCASGLPYWTTDIGGFFVGRGSAWFERGEFDEGVDDLGYRELFLRWFQYAAFLPVFRAHGTGAPREIWHYGEPGNVVYDSLVHFIKLRKALIPYLYSLAAAVYRDGYTMVASSSGSSSVKVHAVRRASGGVDVLIENEDPNNSYTANLGFSGFTPSGSPTVYTYANGGHSVTSATQSSATSVTVAPYSLTVVQIPGGGSTGTTAPGSPGAPIVSNLSAGASSTSGSATLSWTAATAGTYPVSGYQVYQLGPGPTGSTLVGSPSGTTFNLTGLTDGSSYSYDVVALDTQGDASSPSEPVTFTVPAQSGGGGGGCAVHYTTTSTWPGGFGASITVTDTGTAAIDGWTLKFSFPAGESVQSGWNGTFSQTGQDVTVTNASWNGAIPGGGGSVSIGFNGTDTGQATAPSAFTLNGGACSID